MKVIESTLEFLVSNQRTVFQSSSETFDTIMWKYAVQLYNCLIYHALLEFDHLNIGSLCVYVSPLFLMVVERNVQFL